MASSLLGHDQYKIGQNKPLPNTDIISGLFLSRLDWCCWGNEASERQWDDVVRVMEIMGTQVDRESLIKDAAELVVSDLLGRLFGTRS